MWRSLADFCGFPEVWMMFSTLCDFTYMCVTSYTQGVCSCPPKSSTRKARGPTQLPHGPAILEQGFKSHLGVARLFCQAAKGRAVRGNNHCIGHVVRNEKMEVQAPSAGRKQHGPTQLLNASQQSKRGGNWAHFWGWCRIPPPTGCGVKG